MAKILFVALGGSLGALSRYWVAVMAVRLFGSDFPWGTLIVNLAGCFLIGLAFALADRGMSFMVPSARLFFMTGYLGALTTFSTFALESVNALRASALLVALVNVLGTNLAGGALVFLGMWVGSLR
jgi:CrcB protein